MLYIESRRLGRSTALGLLSIAFLILVQGMFSAWKMEQLTDELSENLVTFSDSQLEGLTLKSMIITLRKLEKDMILFHDSPEEFQQAQTRWINTLAMAEGQLSILEEELQENIIYDGPTIASLSTTLHAYSEGATLVISRMLKEHLTQKEAMSAMVVYKQYIYDMEAQLDEIVETSEEHEEHSLKQLEENQAALFWTLGAFALFSVFISIILSIFIYRKSMHISRTLEYQALHDTLTGILNRRGLSVAMTNHTSQGGIMAYIDLDRFKLINDLCGHTVGDELLINLSAKMQSLCRERQCTLARVGGDEFVIWLDDKNGLERLENIATQLVATVEAHDFAWHGQPMKLGASVGIAKAQPNFLFSELVSRADAACRLAKVPGSAKVLVYEESDPMLIEIRREERWAAKIPQMILENHFCLFGQSIVPLHSGETGGHIEILIRGLDDNDQIIAPGTFLPAAERFGLMPSIDRWVIETLLTSNLDNATHFSVNISAHTLADKAYLSELVRLVTDSGKGHQLIFEITESAAMTSIDTARDYISRLKALGCRFSLDDFGSGFSSFAYLRDLNVDYLKIDGSLIKVLGRNDSDAALVQAIVHMSKSLGLKTIAEYVETPELADLLHDMNVDFAQGYGLHKPEPLSNLELFSTITYSRKQ